MDVAGLMYFWGLTIDTVTTVNLLIAIGLTVDYSAHIAHTFMTSAGTRNGALGQQLASFYLNNVSELSAQFLLFFQRAFNVH